MTRAKRITQHALRIRFGKKGGIPYHREMEMRKRGSYTRSQVASLIRDTRK